MKIMRNGRLMTQRSMIPAHFTAKKMGAEARAEEILGSW